MKVTLPGTDTPAPSVVRQSSGYLVEIGEERIVLDYGPDAHHRLIESGHRAVDVDYALFSHLHYDHCLDYPRLVLQRWDMGAGRIAELQVYGPPPLAHMTTLLLGDDGVFDAASTHVPGIAAASTYTSRVAARCRAGRPPRACARCTPATSLTDARGASRSATRSTCSRTWSASPTASTATKDALLFRRQRLLR